MQATARAQSATATTSAQPAAARASAQPAAASAQLGPSSSFKPPRKRAATSQLGEARASAQPGPSASRGRGAGAKRGRRKDASSLSDYKIFHMQWELLAIHSVTFYFCCLLLE